MTNGDEILDEVRAAREALLQEAGGTLEGLYSLLRESEKKEGRILVSLKPRLAAEAEDQAA